MLLHRSADQHHVAASRIADQQDGELQTRQRGSGTIGQVDERRRRQPQLADSIAGDDLLQARSTVMGRDRDAMHGNLAPQLARPRVQRRLQVHVLKRAQ